MTGEPVTYEWFSAVGGIISVANLIAIGTILYRMGAWQGAVDARMNARDEKDAERHEEQVRRFDHLEKKAGITNGGATWVDKEFCREVHRNFLAEVALNEKSNMAFVVKVDEAIESGREAIRVGHEDRIAIKARLVRVEERLGAK